MVGGPSIAREIARQLNEEDALKEAGARKAAAEDIASRDRFIRRGCGNGGRCGNEPAADDVEV